jgi:hypothetical protein
MEAPPATPSSLPDRQLRPGSLGNETLKDKLGFSKTVPSEQQFLNPRAIPTPLLDLVVVAAVSVVRVVGFSLGPVVIGLSAAIGLFAKQRSAWRGNQSRGGA